MGLDITAHERIVLRADLDRHAMEQLYKPSQPWRFDWLYPFPGQGEFATRADGIVEGCYESTGEIHTFGAGSYSGYNRWREQLALMLGTTPEAIWRDPKPGPFVELINFGDNEGVIGPKTSAKLAADFAQWASKAETFGVGLGLAEGPWFIAKYRDWQRAFEIAARHGAGCVHFH